MQTRHFLCFLLPLLLLLLACMPMNEARGGRRGGGGMFGTWRKIKKPSSSSSSSSRRMQGHKSEVPYTPLKSSTYSKTASYPKQQMPAGGTYHTSSAHLPAGATYHGVAVPPGGSYLASGVALPPGAVYIAQTPPQSSFNTGNFLMGMYAGHMLGHGLVGHRTVVHHVYNDNQQQQQLDNQKNKIVIIENGAAAGNNSVSAAVAPLWPTDVDVPLAPFNTTITPPELLLVSTEPIFHRSEQQPSTIASSNEQLPTTMPATQSPIAAATPTSGIICMPLLVNETVASDAGASVVQQVEKTVCFPAPPIPETAPPTEGIICVPQTVLERDSRDPSKTIEVEKQNCYPAPPVPEAAEDITKSPDSVIGNIPAEGDESREQQQIHAALKSLGEEERLAMKDILTETQHKN